MTNLEDRKAFIDAQRSAFIHGVRSRAFVNTEARCLSEYTAKLYPYPTVRRRRVVERDGFSFRVDPSGSFIEYSNDLDHKECGSRSWRDMHCGDWIWNEANVKMAAKLLAHPDEEVEA